MAYNDICTAFLHKTSRRVGCECMVGVDTVFGVRQYGKSTLCLVFNGKLSKWDNVCKWVKQVEIDTPLGEKPGIWFRHEIIGESP